MSEIFDLSPDIIIFILSIFFFGSQSADINIMVSSLEKPQTREYVLIKDSQSEYKVTLSGYQVRRPLELNIQKIDDYSYTFKTNSVGATEATEVAKGAYDLVSIEKNNNIRFRSLHKGQFNDEYEYRFEWIDDSLVIDNRSSGKSYTISAPNVKRQQVKVGTRHSDKLLAFMLRDDAKKFALSLSGDVNLDARDAQGNTLLHLAAMGTQQKIIEILLDRKANPHVLNDNYQDVMHIALTKHNHKLVKLLIERGFRLNHPVRQGLDYVQSAARAKNIQDLKLLLASGKVAIERTSYAQDSVFFDAIDNKYDSSILTILMELNADFCLVDVKNRLLILEFYLKADLEYVKKILKSKRCNNKGNLTRLLTAMIEKSDRLAAQALLQSGMLDKVTLSAGLPVACTQGQFEIAQELIGAGADTNYKSDNEMKYTPLHEAIRAGHLHLVMLLLDKGAKLTAKDKTGRNALDIAIQHGQFTVAGFLLRQGLQTHIDLDEAVQEKLLPKLKQALCVSIKQEGLSAICVTPTSATNPIKDPQQFQFKVAQTKNSRIDIELASEKQHYLMPQGIKVLDSGDSKILALVTHDDLPHLYKARVAHLVVIDTKGKNISAQWSSPDCAYPCNEWLAETLFLDVSHLPLKTVIKLTQGSTLAPLNSVYLALDSQNLLKPVRGDLKLKGGSVLKLL